MPAPRIVIEHFPNDLIREFHVNERISSEKLYDSLPGADALKYRIGEVAPLHDSDGPVVLRDRGCNQCQP